VSRGVLLAALAAVAVPTAGCAHRTTPPPTALRTLEPVTDLDAFEAGLNGFVLLPEGNAQRDEYRAKLLTFLRGYLTDALEEGDTPGAATSLRYAVFLFTPAELRAPAAQPGLADAAHALYRTTASRGDVDPSLLALAVEECFGTPKRRKQALRDWETLEAWLTENNDYADEPLWKYEPLQRSLEKVAATFPSPFVVQRLADLYVARYQAAVRAQAHGQNASAAARRIEISGYLLMRLYLRADDSAAALDSLSRVELDPPVAKLREVLADALKPRRSPKPILALAEQFLPEPGSDPSLPYVIQAWGIVDNLARQTLRSHPKDPYAHLLRARAFIDAGLVDAAIHHLRRSIEIKEDVFESWAQLAELEQRSLSQLASSNPSAALERVAAVEALHRRAVELWRDRPIRPGLPEAYYVVAEGLYQAGRVDEAMGLLGRGRTLQPGPQTLDLLGTIALKRRLFDEARAHYEALATLPYDSDLSQLQWEARARQQLGIIALQAGDSAASAKHFKLALRHTNELLAQGEATTGVRSDRYVERGKLLFFLGDIELAMNDFEHAANLAPDQVKVYAEPLLHAVSYGYQKQALQIFRRAMAQRQLADSLKLYFSLWMNELALVQGLAPSGEATAFLAAYSGDAWGAKLARHARGDLPFDDLLEGAADRGERAEAFFYEGLQRWRSGDRARGESLMTRVVETEMMGFFEYDLAQGFLSRGELPTRPQTPLPGMGKAAAR